MVQTPETCLLALAPQRYGNSTKMKNEARPESFPSTLLLRAAGASNDLLLAPQIARRCQHTRDWYTNKKKLLLCEPLNAEEAGIVYKQYVRERERNSNSLV